MALTQIVTTDSVSASVVNTKIVDPANIHITDFETRITKQEQVLTATLSTTWVGSTAPYTQTITVAGITENHEPRIYPIYSDILEMALLQKESAAMVTYWDTGAGTITFTCLEDKPTIAIPIAIKGA